MIDHGFDRYNTYIYYSDFQRTKESALEITDDIFEWKTWSGDKESIDEYFNHLHFHCLPSKLLRARNYGELNGLYGKDMISKFEEITKHDQIDPNHTKYNVESFNDAVNRTKQFVINMENQGRENKDKKRLIIMVTHAMAAQALQTWFQNNHKIPEPMKNGEFRFLHCHRNIISKL